MSNKSLFNKTLIKKDIKILLPLLILNVIYMFIAYPFKYMQLLGELKDVNSNVYYVLDRISSTHYNYMFNIDIIIFIFAIIGSIILFAHEKGKKTIEVIAVAPFSRKQIYINKLVSGFIAIILPSIVIFFITYLMIASNTMISSLNNISLIRHLFISNITVQILIFSYYTMISMFFGAVGSTLICGTIITFLPAGPIYMANVLLEQGSEKSLASMSEIFTPFAILMKSIDFDTAHMLYFPLFSIVLLVAGYYLFEFYKMEKNSEFLTFKWTEPVFKIGFFICSSLLVSIIMTYVLVDVSSFRTINKVIGLVIGGVGGYFIPKFLISVNKAA